MKRSILKLIWNRRKDYLWIFIEQILVFVVLLYCFILITIRLEQFFHPGKLDIEDVYLTGVIPNISHFPILDGEIQWGDYFERLSAMENRIFNSEFVEFYHVGFYTVPENRASRNNKQDSLIYNSLKYNFYLKISDGNFSKVFHPQIIEGEWFEDHAFDDGAYPMMITKTLAENLNLLHPIGAKINFDGRSFVVTGVINDFKTMVFDEATPSAIFAFSAFRGTKYEQNRESAIRVKKGQGQNFVDYYWKEATATFPNEGHQSLVLGLDKLSNTTNLEIYLSLIIIIIPTVFLLVFAFLGTFSLLYKQAKKHMGEYGLRIALGSTKLKIIYMIINESIFITICASLVGFIISLNVFVIIFDEIDILTFLFSVFGTSLIMLLFSIISVGIPAYQAKNIQPSEALKLDL